MATYARNLPVELVAMILKLVPEKHTLVLRCLSRVWNIAFACGPYFSLLHAATLRRAFVRRKVLRNAPIGHWLCCWPQNMKDAAADIAKRARVCHFHAETCSSGNPLLMPASFGLTKFLSSIIIKNLQSPLPASFYTLLKLKFLDLDGSRLNGPLSPLIGNFKNLQYLSLDSCGLEGPIPGELGKCVNIMDLKLGNNQFSGGVPDIFGKFANIKWLDLSNNNLSGNLNETPSLFTRMNLTTLLLDHNSFTGSIPESIRNLTSLSSLCLAHNQLTGPIPATLSSITFIKHIVLNNNLLCGQIPASLIHLTSLTTLRLQGNKLTGPLPPEFGGMMRLRLLDISHNPGIIGSLSTKFGRDPKKKDEVDTRALKELLLNGTGMDVAKNGNMLLDKYVAHKVQHNHMQVKRVCKTNEGGRCVECEEARVKNEERGNGENLVDLE